MNRKCTKCISQKSTASAKLQGIKCLKPFAVNSPSTCNFGSLGGILYGGNAKCFRHRNGQKFNATLFLPRPTTFNYFGLATKKYIIRSITLGGIRAQNKGVKKRNGREYIKLKFKGKDRRNVAGQKVFLNGIIVVDGGFRICFSAQGQVC